MRTPLQARTVHIVSRDAQRPELQWESVGASESGATQSSVPLRLLVGDVQDDSAEDLYQGNAVKVHAYENGEIAVRTSLTGFPPLYCYCGPGPLVVSSGIRPIAATPGVRLRFDARGVAEWIRIGKPIAHRTLFRDLQLLPAGITVRIAAGKSFTRAHEWSAPRDIAFANYEEYLDAQAEAFGNAIRRTDTNRSFISLTAGLDTRAVLATLVRDGRRIDAVTMSGRSDSLDARRARTLCAALGMRHSIVRQGHDFFDAIEQHTLNAVRLSGGLSGLDGALEVYMYSTLGGMYQARLSGNLGNQVGRSGTEGVGTRGLLPEWFADDVQAAIKSLPPAHWHRQIASGGDGLSALDLIQRESLFASLANATIGSTLAVQQTPYADRRVLENKLAEPVIADAELTSVRGIRMRDLKHRMFGEPVTQSFQRRIVMATGGPVARIPINWGWRPVGGMSVPGMLLGGAAGLDAMLTRRPQFRRLVKPVSQLLGIQGLNGFGSDPLWLDDRAKAFVRDTLNDAMKARNPLLARSHVEQSLLRSMLPDELSEIAAELVTLVLASREFGVSEGVSSSGGEH